MNLILFEPHELVSPLLRTDRRAVHLLQVLRRKTGDNFDAGVINGPRGKGTIVDANPRALSLVFTWGDIPKQPPPITLIVGLPRPQTARDILRDVTSLGVDSMHFVLTEKGDANYLCSSLWTTGEWRRHLILGAEQAFSTQLPDVSSGATLVDVLRTLPYGGTRLALDNYESPLPLSHSRGIASPVILAIGPERGWAAPDRDMLRAHNFNFVHLGERVLRTETACIAAVAVVRALLGLI